MFNDGRTHRTNSPLPHNNPRTRDVSGHHQQPAARSRQRIHRREHDRREDRSAARLPPKAGSRGEFLRHARARRQYVSGAFQNGDVVLVLRRSTMQPLRRNRRDQLAMMKMTHQAHQLCGRRGLARACAAQSCVPAPPHRRRRPRKLPRHRHTACTDTRILKQKNPWSGRKGRISAGVK